MKRLKTSTIRNLANLLTGIRILATFLVCHRIGLLLDEKGNMVRYIEIAALFLIIWISDIADGEVARRLKISSVFGAKFDVIADAIFVFMIHLLLASYHIVPIWFIALMAEKILNYIVSSYIVSKRGNSNFRFIRDPWGKTIAASYFLTPCLLLAGHIAGDGLRLTANIFLAVIAILGICSSVYRIVRILGLRRLWTITYGEGLSNIESRKTKEEMKYGKTD